MRISTILMTLTLAVSAFAADVAGKWKATMEGPNGSMQITFDLKVDAKKVTGKAIGDMGEMQISEGTIDGDHQLYRRDRSIQGCPQGVSIPGNELKLKVDMGDNSMEMVASASGRELRNAS